MTMPKAYDPQPGYTYQILVMCPGEREYEACDYAADKADLKHLLENYRDCYGPGYRFKSILLPAKYWTKPDPIRITAEALDYRDWEVYEPELDGGPGESYTVAAWHYVGKVTLQREADAAQVIGAMNARKHFPDPVALDEMAVTWDGDNIDISTAGGMPQFSLRYPRRP